MRKEAQKNHINIRLEIVMSFVRMMLSGFKGFIIGAIVAFTISFFVFALLNNNIPSTFLDLRTKNFITKDLDDVYKYKFITKPIKPDDNSSIIIWGNDINFNQYCFPDDVNKQFSRDILSDEIEKIKSNIKITNKPFIKIYKLNDFALDNLIPYFKQNFKEYDTINIEFINSPYFDFDETNKADDYWINDVQVEDLNSDGIDEIIVQAYTYVCASGGTKFLYIFNDIGGKIAYTASSPDIGFEYNNTLSGISTQDQIIINEDMQKINFSSVDTYLKFVDLNNDNQKEMVIGYPLYGKDFNTPEDECHLCEHYWVIGVYKFNGKEFITDNSWYNGRLYLTKKKISLGDGIGYLNAESNLFALLGIYYFDCEFCDAFHNSDRKKSEILRIVEENYGKRLRDYREVEYSDEI